MIGRVQEVKELNRLYFYDKEEDVTIVNFDVFTYNSINTT